MVQPVVRLTAGRRRVRRGRLPRHRPGLRLAGRGRGAHPRGARARSADHRRRRSESLLLGAPVVPGGAGDRTRLGRPGSVLVPARSRCRRRVATQQLAVHLRRPGLDANHQPGWHPRRVVPAPVRGRTARPQLGEPQGTGGVRGRAAVLVRPRRRRRPHRLGRAADEGSRPRATSTRTIRRGRIPIPIATRFTTCTGRGGRSPTAIPSRVRSSARSGCRTPSGSPPTCAPTSSTPPSTSRSSGAPGRHRPCVGPSTRRSTCTRSSGRPRPGYCPITTFRAM